LFSWAVTKGPSLNPADRQQAVRTEVTPSWAAVAD
jgi:hypothetical protein